MNTKSFLVSLALLLLAVMFVPIIPNDSGIECTGDSASCDEVSPYVSLYTKFLK